MSEVIAFPGSPRLPAAAQKLTPDDAVMLAWCAAYHELSDSNRTLARNLVSELVKAQRQGWTR